MTDAIALISRAGRAVVRDGKAFYVFTVDDSEPHPADGTHWTHLRSLHPDCEIMPAGQHPFQAVRARMLEAWREKLGLDLLLISADRDYDDEHRRETCTVLDTMLGEQRWLPAKLRDIVLSVEVPAEADLSGAETLAVAAGAHIVEGIFHEWLDASEAISAVLAAWQSAVATLATPAERREATIVAERLRAVGTAVMAVCSSAPGARDELRTWCQQVLQSALMPVTPDAAALMERWLTAIDNEQAVASDLLAASTTHDLARAIRQHLHAAEPSAGIDRRRCNAIVRAVGRLPQGEARARFASAVLLLLGEVVTQPEPVSGEWPTGLFAVARRIAWTAEQLDTIRRMLVSVLYHTSHHRTWPIGALNGSLLGSTVLEAHRTARFADLGPADHRDALLSSIGRLSPRPRVAVDPELGYVLGILASYGAAEAYEAVQRLRQVDLGVRSRVLAEVAREHRIWAGNSHALADALLSVVGGIGNIRALDNPPTAEEQRWAADAVRSLGALTPEHERKADLLIVPESPAAKRTIKAPPWARGRVA